MRLKMLQSKIGRQTIYRIFKDRAGYGSACARPASDLPMTGGFTLLLPAPVAGSFKYGSADRGAYYTYSGNFYIIHTISQ